LRCICTILLLIGLSNLSISQSDRFVETVKEYYRVDPFSGSFSGFIQALTSDTALLNKIIHKQTDSTGFHVSGEYNIFNPFSIKANKVSMMLYEIKEKRDEVNILTYFSYQLTAFLPDNIASRKVILRDYKRLCKKLSRDLFITHKKSLKDFKTSDNAGKIVSIEDGEITTFTHDDFFAEPAIVSWQTMGESGQLALTIIIKLKQENNSAIPFGMY